MTILSGVLFRPRSLGVFSQSAIAALLTSARSLVTRNTESGSARARASTRRSVTPSPGTASTSSPIMSSALASRGGMRRFGYTPQSDNSLSRPRSMRPASGPRPSTAAAASPAVACDAAGEHGSGPPCRGDALARSACLSPASTPAIPPHASMCARRAAAGAGSRPSAWTRHRGGWRARFASEPPTGCARAGVDRGADDAGGPSAYMAGAHPGLAYGHKPNPKLFNPPFGAPCRALVV